MAHHRQARRARKHHPDLPAVPRARAEPGRERLAVSPPELALKHRVRKLRRHRRRRMRRLAQTHSRPGKDHIHRNARLGPRSAWRALVVGAATAWARTLLARHAPRSSAAACSVLRLRRRGEAGPGRTGVFPAPSRRRRPPGRACRHSASGQAPPTSAKRSAAPRLGD